MTRGWVWALGFGALSCHQEGPRTAVPRLAPTPTTSAAAAVTGKIAMCVTDSSFEPLGRLRYQLLEGDLLVHQGETNELGCMERHGLPPGHYYLVVAGYEPLAAMLLDEGDSEPLLRAPVKSPPQAPR